MGKRQISSFYYLKILKLNLKIHVVFKFLFLTYNLNLKLQSLIILKSAWFQMQSCGFI
jgi:hypothetical protein